MKTYYQVYPEEPAAAAGEDSWAGQVAYSRAQSSCIIFNILTFLYSFQYIQYNLIQYHIVCAIQTGRKPVANTQIWQMDLYQLFQSVLQF